MPKDASPAHRRESLITQLETFVDSGLTDVLRATPAREALPATVTPAPATVVAVSSVGSKGYGKPPGPVAPASPHPDAGLFCGSGKQGEPAMLEATPENLTPIGTLTELRNFIGACTRCPLCAGRNSVVFGTGDPKARLMFVGEGPGADEDTLGVPFVGRAGQLLTKMIEAMGLKREAVYIANIVKCRPPDNRNPAPEEIATCLPFLKKQIALVNPAVMVCLGKVAVQALLLSEVPISKLRGQWLAFNGIPVMPTFHPAYLLRSPLMKKFCWQDLKQVMTKM